MGSISELPFRATLFFIVICVDMMTHTRMLKAVKNNTCFSGA